MILTSFLAFGDAGSPGPSLAVDEASSSLCLCLHTAFTLRACECVSSPLTRTAVTGVQWPVTGVRWSLDEGYIVLLFPNKVTFSGPELRTSYLMGLGGHNSTHISSRGYSESIHMDLLHQQ